jgi:tetratricopeptide (TPR) repeat protein
MSDHKETKVPDLDFEAYQQLGRNLKGLGLEKSGQVDKAIQLYEENVRENFEGTYPYGRLATIYRERDLIDKEIRVLEKIIWIFENIIFEEQDHRLPELKRFKKRLKQAKELKLKKP